MVDKMNCNFLENILRLHGNLVYCTRTLSLIHWKSFTFTDRSVKTTKLFHLEQLAIYSIGAY